MSGLLWVGLIAAWLLIGGLSRKLGVYNEIHWGGRHSDHPGWWLHRTRDNAWKKLRRREP